MLRLTRLTLTDFRNYAGLVWHDPGRIAVVTGANGSGKTNLLEAVSLLTPGRGLRGARGAAYPRQGQGQGASGRWAVAARLDQAGTLREIGTGVPEGAASDRRVFRLDGAPARNQADLAAACACVWLTPQMDRLFAEGPGSRRRFLDRLVWTLEPGHAREVAAAESATSSRNRVLAMPRPDAAWLAGLEDAMARHGIAAAAARASLVARLNAALDSGAADPFPRARVVLLDALAERLAAGSALAAEDWLRDTLAAQRGADAAAGTAAVGAHRADMQLEDAETGLPAELASTGQRKSLLIATILGHAALIAATRATPPLLLLDEPAVHLDAARRAALFQALAGGPAQAFVTGTDAEPFAALRGHARFWQTGGNALTEG